MNRSVPKLGAIVLVLFGLLTVFMSSSIVFDWFDIREKEGNYVLFIVVLNFTCGILYLFSAFGLFFQKRWTTKLLLAVVAMLVLGFMGLLWHINSGRPFEEQTVKAMLFRIGFTMLFAGLSWRYASKKHHS